MAINQRRVLFIAPPPGMSSPYTVKNLEGHDIGLSFVTQVIVSEQVNLQGPLTARRAQRRVKAQFKVFCLYSNRPVICADHPHSYALPDSDAPSFLNPVYELHSRNA